MGDAKSKNLSDLIAVRLSKRRMGPHTMTKKSQCKAYSREFKKAFSIAKGAGHFERHSIDGV
jgi:hypothetical protein